MLVRGVTWGTHPMPGCCGAHMISRLHGRCTTKEQQEGAIALWYRNVKRTKRVRIHSNISHNMHGWKGTLHRILTGLSHGPQPFNRIPYRYPSGSWNGGAVPVEIAFATVFTTIPKQAIVFLADNIDEEGDYIPGVFTTRKFAKWFADNDMGHIITGGPVQSRRTTNNIQGWILHPNYARVTRVMKDAAEFLTNRIEELNNDPRVKQLAQNSYHTRARDTEALSAQLGEW